MKPFLLLLCIASVAMADDDPGAPPKFYPLPQSGDPVVRELRALRGDMATQADWAAIYQIYPNNPAFYRWLDRNPRYLPYYLGRR